MGHIAGLISILGFFPYILGVLKGKVIPNRITWTIWTIFGSILLMSYISASGGFNISAWVPICYVVGPAIIMLLSFRYGEGGHNCIDIISFIISIISLFFWVITGIPIVALAANILADALAAVPTIYKAYFRPETESAFAWSFFLLGNTLNLFAIPKVNFYTFLYPFYLFLVSFIICILIFTNYLARKSKP